MRVAKYDANPENPQGRATLRFRFTQEELDRLAVTYGNGDPSKLRFRLEVEQGEAKLVPSGEGHGMRVTHSPSGKNYPWEVGFNHRSSPVIDQLAAIPTQEAPLRLGRDFASIPLPAPGSTKPTPRRVTREDFRAAITTPADMEVFRQAIKTANQFASTLGIPLECKDGQVRAIIA